MHVSEPFVDAGVAAFEDSEAGAFGIGDGEGLSEAWGIGEGDELADGFAAEGAVGEGWAIGGPAEFEATAADFALAVEGLVFVDGHEGELPKGDVGSRRAWFFLKGKGVEWSGGKGRKATSSL